METEIWCHGITFTRLAGDYEIEAVIVSLYKIALGFWEEILDQPC